MSHEATITLGSTIVQTTSLVSSTIDEDIVMLDVERGVYYGVSDVGSRIWQLLEEPRSLNTITEILLSEYEVDRATCEQHVLEFVRELYTKHLVKLADSAG